MSALRPRRLLAFLTLLLGQALQLAVAAPAKIDDSMAQRMAACTLCHGREGRAAPDGFRPRIAGKPAGYLYNQLVNFRDGRRHYGPMVRLMDPLSDRYLREIAEYFAALDLPYPAAIPSLASRDAMRRGEQLALQGDAGAKLPACTECHGARLTGMLPATPGLLGLPRDYLSAQLGAWQTGLRRAHEPDCMASLVRRMQPGDIASVSAWLASQPVPANSHAAAPTRRALPLRCGSAQEVSP
jgi:cytochrome c553